VLLEQRPRAQSGHVLRPPQGAFVIFPTRRAPNAATNATTLGLRHGREHAHARLAHGARSDLPPTRNCLEIYESPLGPLTLPPEAAA